MQEVLDDDDVMLSSSMADLVKDSAGTCGPSHGTPLSSFLDWQDRVEMVKDVVDRVYAELQHKAKKWFDEEVKETFHALP